MLFNIIIFAFTTLVHSSSSLNNLTLIDTDHQSFPIRIEQQNSVSESEIVPDGSPIMSLTGVAASIVDVSKKMDNLSRGEAGLTDDALFVIKTDKTIPMTNLQEERVAIPNLELAVTKHKHSKSSLSSRKPIKRSKSVPDRMSKIARSETNVVKMVRFSETEPIVHSYEPEDLTLAPDEVTETETATIELTEQMLVQVRDIPRPKWTAGIEDEGFTEDLSPSTTENSLAEDLEDDHASLISRSEYQQVPDSEQVYQVSIPKEGDLSHYIKQDTLFESDNAVQDVRALRVKAMIDRGESGTTKISALSVDCTDGYFLESHQAEDWQRNNRDQPRPKVFAKSLKRLSRINNNQDLLTVEQEIPLNEVRGFTNDRDSSKLSMRMLIDPDARGSKRVVLDLTTRSIEGMCGGINQGIRTLYNGVPVLINGVLDSGKKLLQDSMSHPEGSLYKVSTNINRQITYHSESLKEQRFKLINTTVKIVTQGLEQSKMELSRRMGFGTMEEMGVAPKEEYDEEEELVKVRLEDDLVEVELSGEDLEPEDMEWVTAEIVKRTSVIENNPVLDSSSSYTNRSFASSSSVPEENPTVDSSSSCTSKSSASSSSPSPSGTSQAASQDKPEVNLEDPLRDTQ